MDCAITYIFNSYMTSQAYIDRWNTHTRIINTQIQTQTRGIKQTNIEWKNKIELLINIIWFSLPCLWTVVRTRIIKSYNFSLYIQFFFLFLFFCSFFSSSILSKWHFSETNTHYKVQCIIICWLKRNKRQKWSICT